MGRPRSELIGKLRRELAFLRGNPLVLIVSWAIWSPFSHAVGVYEQVYVMALGATVFILGLMSALSSAILGVVRFFGGYVADRYGRKRILVSMTFTYSSALFLYALAPDWRWIFVASLITSACLLYQPALSAIHMDSIPPEKRGVGFSISSLLPELVALPAPLLAIYLVGRFGLVKGMRLAYALMALAGLTAGAVRLKLKETWSPKEESVKDFLEGYKEALRFASGSLRPLIMVLVLASLAMGFNAVIQPFVIFYLGVPLARWGLIYLLGSVAWLAILIPAGALVDKLGRRASYLLGVALTSASLATLAFIGRGSGFWLIAGTLLIFWCSSYLIYNPLSALEADLVPRELRGRLSALLALLSDVASGLSALLCGWLYKAVGPVSAVVMCSTAALAAFLMGLAFLREPEVRHG